MRKILCSVALVLGLSTGWARAQQPTTSTASTRTNAAWVQGVGPGYWPTAGTGLSLKLAAGTAFCGGAIQNYAGGSLTLTPSATNYVYLDPALNCAPNANASGFSPSVIPIAIVTTSTSAVAGITDVRTEFVASGAAPVVAGTCPSNQFVAAISSSAPTCAQPAFSNLSGTAAVAQLPLATAAGAGILQLSGDMSGSAATPVVAGIQGKPGIANPSRGKSVPGMERLAVGTLPAVVFECGRRRGGRAATGSNSFGSRCATVGGRFRGHQQHPSRHVAPGSPTVIDGTNSQPSADLQRIELDSGHSRACSGRRNLFR
jgi:hypothetical protein